MLDLMIKAGDLSFQMCKTGGELISIDALTDTIDSSSTLSDYIGDDLQPTATALRHLLEIQMFPDTRDKHELSNKLRTQYNIIIPLA